MKKHILALALVILIFHISSLISAHAEVQHNVSVTATVPPTIQDFQFSLTTTRLHRLPQEQTITFEITYGASSSAGVNTTNTIVVDFSNDRAPDGTHVTDYVIGSASDGYNGAQPVIDLTNRTITWTLSNFPPGTVNQKLSFDLKTNSNYSGNRTVDFTIGANMRNEYITMPEQQITHEYLFDPALITPGPTRPIVLTATPIPAPTPGPPPLRITDVSFVSITDNSATISMTTNRPAKERILWGTTPSSLTERVQTDAYALTNTLTLANLKPNTQYYFRIIAFDVARKVAESELFTFTTARESELPDLSNNAVVITSGETVVLSDIVTSDRIPFGILTSNTDYVLTYTFDRAIPLANLEVIIRDQNGSINRIVGMVQKDYRVYVANLRTVDTGTYDAFLRMTDNSGNVIEQRIAKLKVILRMQVLEKGTNLPIGDARVLLKYYNPATKRFEELTPVLFGNQKNPGFTDTMGELTILLPAGKYQAHVSALGYDEQTIAFTLDRGNGEDFPIVYLQKNMFNVSAVFYFVKDWLWDLFNTLLNVFLPLVTSIRFFNSVAFIVLFSFVALGFLLFRIRTDIKFHDLVPFFLFHLSVIARRHKDNYIYGLITDNKNTPLTQVRIEVIDLKSASVLTHALSNKSGRFVIRNTFKQEYIKLIASKEGFAESEIIVPTTDGKTVQIHLEEHNQGQTTMARSLYHTAGELFELTMLLCLIIELLFIASFGIARTLPFFILSVFNLLLWLFFQKEKKL